MVGRVVWTKVVVSRPASGSTESESRSSGRGRAGGEGGDGEVACTTGGGGGGGGPGRTVTGLAVLHTLGCEVISHGGLGLVVVVVIAAENNVRIIQTP